MRRLFAPLPVIGALVLLASAAPALGQESPSFKLEESVLNAGGDPRDGVALASASFRISLHSLGEGIAAPQLAGSSFLLQGGFAAPLRPPGEVLNLRFTGAIDLAWNAESTVGEYALYRGMISAPFDPGYGSCIGPGITSEAFTDATAPGPGSAFFYLVTARNRLLEEGTKGAGTDLVERANPAPCP